MLVEVLLQLLVGEVDAELEGKAFGRVERGSTRS
jgi:hypothetical protein